MTVDAVLAAESSGPSLLVVIIPALIIAVLLIGAFFWGSRRWNRRRAPGGPGPTGQGADSWRTPEGEGPGRTAPRHEPDEPFER
ncbi:hypothetical protein HUT16_02065 [Kitasatospora sp. NA04385]|uniref:DUF6479 family protein n=1 Tax=Kitasatospora sp. NA04385 TaxID=2742135 RepID=UPI001591ACE0|nr:DUF6479 family protein [Kitasatospora sp. NA04385]QKW18008.1 hypothetical protein HUT16_02065 [Kitasatospora sp. NA04385]